MPEVGIKLAIVNFIVTQDGLEEQLLVDVVKSQAPEVEMKRDHLLVLINDGTNQIDNYQEMTLDELEKSDQEMILDNEQLIETLENTRVKSRQIAGSLKQQQVAEKIID
jgi:dynein heavy chain